LNLRNKINGIKEMWKFDNRIQLIFNRIIFPKEDLSIYRIKNVEFLNDHANGDSNGARDVLTSPMYQNFLKTLQFSKPINVLDLGSNNGGFALLVKLTGFQVKKLVCVEVNPKTFSRLRFNIERNFDCELHLLNIALCGENKDLFLSFDKGDVGNSIYQNGNESSQQKIQGINFDEIVRLNFDDEKVDICKIDVEGAEFDMFLLENHLKINECHYLLIEIHHKENTKDRNREIVLSKLKSLGFTEKVDEIANKSNVHFFINDKWKQ
jgi:FkbM family methyltransferase